jgi:hypothetical protein
LTACSDEEVIGGDAHPWRIGETRRYRKVRIEAGENDAFARLGYNSSPSLGSALFLADGPIACRVEVSEPFRRIRTERGRIQINRRRRLLDARDLGLELRLFACDCASRILHLYESANSSSAPRSAIETTRLFGKGNSSQDVLESAMRSAREVAESVNGKARLAAWAATASSFEDATDAATARGLVCSLHGDGRTQVAARLLRV